MRDALREAMKTFELFLAQIPAMPEEEDDEHYPRPLDIPHASYSLQRICKLRGSMIDPCIIQGTLGHMKLTAFRLIQDPR